MYCMPARASLPAQISHHTQDAIFRRVHGGNLVYNTCWEDPRLDRAMMRLDASSRVVMITSAGCNALDYLLDNPAEIHAVDVNPRQNALLELKKAMIRLCDFEELFQTFGYGAHPDMRGLLGRLSGGLPPHALRYWQDKHYYFRRTSLNPSFYYRGTAGQMAWLTLHTFLGSAQVRDYVDALLHINSLEEQRRLYAHVRPLLWGRFITLLLRQPMAMTMLGVPRAQVRLIETRFPGGLCGYIQQKMEHVLTEVPFWDNYFWRVYFTGHYTPGCCPNYLVPEHQAVLREREPRLKTHTATLANFLREHPGSYTHFVLLDHQDWLATHKPQALHEEWQLLLENSAPGACILMRSASPQIDFIPPEILQRLQLDTIQAQHYHPLDRVGTYGCTLFARVLP
jgi:S-adenosylmethionine-diacylglycerol 3-amino-3-carboxypropyl transferase